MSTITWQFQAAIPGGPAFTISQPPIAAQAYDVATATVAQGTTTVGVDVVVAPPSTAGDIVLVVVNSDVFDPGITYTVDGGSDEFALDAPHVLLGSGAVKFMNGGTPQKLTFKNAFTKDANVQVVVGRKV
jgi:hypothetical protein